MSITRRCEGMNAYMDRFLQQKLNFTLNINSIEGEKKFESNKIQITSNTKFIQSLLGRSLGFSCWFLQLFSSMNYSSNFVN